MKTSTNPENNGTETAGATEKTGTVSYLCMKYNRHQQGDHPTCRDPKLYCKFRPQCMIHYTEKRNRRKLGGAQD